MKKALKDIFFEHGELSIKRVLAFILTIIMIDLYISIRSCEEVSESHLFLFGELLSAIFLVLGLVVANKHKSLNKSTNDLEESG